MKEKIPSGMERIALIGVGAVGSTTAYAMLQAGITSEILLCDHDPDRAEGERMDLMHGLPFIAHAVRLRTASIDEVEHCDVIIITAGAAQKPGESRLNLVLRNVEIFTNFMPRLAKQNPFARFIIVTNPVDVMTRVALKLTGLPACHVIGSGTVLDTARFRSLLSAHCGVQSRHVHAYVIGEHGDSEVLVWSRAMIGPFSMTEYTSHHGIPFTEADREQIDKGVREAAYYIIERKGATHFAIGLATVHILQGLASDQTTIMTVSRRLEGSYGLHDLCLSAMTHVDKMGARPHCQLPLSDNEEALLLQSAEVVDGVYQQLGI